jgi:hypothetical protein
MIRERKEREEREREEALRAFGIDHSADEEDEE